MPTLASELRNKLDRTVIEARDVAENGARAALEALAVHHHEPYPHMMPAQRELRNHLRARARQLGDRQEASGRLTINHLVGECAYEHWHRMLFARFLAENGLLIEPQDNMAISLAEADELAKEVGVDVWVFASRCAQEMLPQIFRPEDPLLQVSFAREHRAKLEGLLDSLPVTVFTASDALGWVYQFWQSKKKDEVNRSEVKIGADEIAAVTQLFTEPYMVEFLLHNTLGAWWAGKKLVAKDTANAKTEDELRRRLALPGSGWEYLRFVRGLDGSGGAWRPAAGTFDGWPNAAKDIKVLDPCCGSGHFLVAALQHLVPIRMSEEGLSPREGVDAVLRGNLHGLEIDERCCQIAAFALAFAAWTYPDAGGYRTLPDLNIACTGIGPQSTQEQWIKLAEQSGLPIPGSEREKIKNALLNLHRLFSQAPTLGSLINPTELSGDLLTASYGTIQPYLTEILKAEKADDETRERAIAAAGMAKAAELLASKYMLVITNVPYLARKAHCKVLSEWADANAPEARNDLATLFVLRCLDLLSKDGVAALVTPQNWFFLTTYGDLRKKLLGTRTLFAAARLGPEAFDAITGHVVNVALSVIGQTSPATIHWVGGLDAQDAKRASGKAVYLQQGGITMIPQKELLGNPDSRIVLERLRIGDRLSEYAHAYQGVSPADLPHYGRMFWELDALCGEWRRWQSTIENTVPFGGRDLVLWWNKDFTDAVEEGVAYIRGEGAWGRTGVGIKQMGNLPATIYTGEVFDTNIAIIVPRKPALLAAIWMYCSSEEYSTAVRKLDRKMNVTNATLVKVSFDLAHWQKLAAKKYPDGLLDPESDDPTQWLFHGWPEDSTSPLQVAVAHLLGYSWPAELDPKMRLSKRARALVKRCEELAKFADDDGIVCIPSVRGEDPATDRLLTVLATAGIKPEVVRGHTDGDDLDDWLRNSFFEEHCKLFHERPFVWHIWDGRKRDGFHALVNYHKLCEGGGKGRRLLESLTYAYLGDWISRQNDGVKRGEGGAEDRLAAALGLQKRLESILAGELPFDIFVRWKPLAKQPIGWEPDINDGVRLNIRPFLASDVPNGRSGAGVLRYKPNIKWAKDRGKEPDRPRAEYPWFWGWDEKTEDFAGGKKVDGNRWNDCHYTNKTKQSARDAAKEARRG